MDDSYDVWYVGPSGGVNYSGYFVIDSYGRRSPDTRRQYDMLIFDVYTDGEVRQNNGTYSYSYGIWLKYASKFIQKILVVKIAGHE